MKDGEELICKNVQTVVVKIQEMENTPTRIVGQSSDERIKNVSLTRGVKENKENARQDDVIDVVTNLKS